MKAQKLLITTLTIAALMGLQSLRAAYAGAGVGYMIDSEEELFTAHVGFEVAAKGSLSHNMEFEIGYVEDSEMGVDVEIMPLMLNYRAINTVNESYDFYFGGGAGISKVDVSGFGLSDDDSVFTVQLMVGMDFKLSSEVALRLGYRYIYLETVELFGIELDELDDSVVELGLVVKF